jgi:hypothetical protein
MGGAVLETENLPVEAAPTDSGARLARTGLSGHARQSTPGDIVAVPTRFPVLLPGPPIDRS